MTNSLAVYRSVTLYLTNLCAQCSEISTQMAHLPLTSSKSLSKAVAILTCANYSPETSCQSIDKLYKINFLENFLKMKLKKQLKRNTLDVHVLFRKHIVTIAVVFSLLRFYSMGRDVTFKFVESFQFWGSYCPKHSTNIVKFWLCLCLLHCLSL